MDRMRLERLVKVLGNVQDDRFDMSKWKCGTSACAAGWAAQDRILKAQGLDLEPSYRPGHFIPTYAGKRDFAALLSFFDLSLAEAYFLFDPDAYDEGETGDAEILDALREGEWDDVDGSTISRQDVIDRVMLLLHE